MKKEMQNKLSETQKQEKKEQLIKKLREQALAERAVLLQKLNLKVGDKVKYVRNVSYDENKLLEGEKEKYFHRLAYEGRIGKLVYITPSKRCYVAMEDGFTYYFTFEPRDIVKVG